MKVGEGCPLLPPTISATDAMGWTTGSQVLQTSPVCIHNVEWDGMLFLIVLLYMHVSMQQLDK
jgi:hypothetical protein